MIFMLFLYKIFCLPTDPKNIETFPETRHLYFLALVEKYFTHNHLNVRNKNACLGFKIVFTNLDGFVRF